MNIFCKRHGRTKHYKRADGPPRCSKCAYSYVANNHNKKKEKFLELLGGKCKICGYKESPNILALRKLERDPNLLYETDILSQPWKVILNEYKEYILLCKNCKRYI